MLGRYREGGRSGGVTVTIMLALMALLADHVMGLAATSHREFLVEVDRHLARPRLGARRRVGRLPA
jgi:hypothetical protein